MEAGQNRIISALKITGTRTSGGGINGTGIIVRTTSFAIAVANLSCLDQIILTDGSAIIVVEAIAPGGAASVSIGASCNFDGSAKCIAGGCRTIEGVIGTRVGIVAGGWAISITNFVCFYDTIAAIRAAIGIVIVIAATRTASVAVGASGNTREHTNRITIR